MGLVRCFVALKQNSWHSVIDSVQERSRDAMTPSIRLTASEVLQWFCGGVRPLIGRSRCFFPLYDAGSTVLVRSRSVQGELAVRNCGTASTLDGSAAAECSLC
jgi:hypothetical protein